MRILDPQHVFFIVEPELFLDQAGCSCFLIKWRWKNATDVCQPGVWESSGTEGVADQGAESGCLTGWSRCHSGASDQAAASSR